MLRVLKAFFPTVLATYALASLLVTQFNLASLKGMGVAIALPDRLAASLHDLMGLSSSYLILILVAFTLALPLAAGLVHMLPRFRLLLYVVAGAVAIVAIHVIFKLALGVNGIAAVRSTAGLLAQGVAGALGGYLYHRLSMPHSVAEQLE